MTCRAALAFLNTTSGCGENSEQQRYDAYVKVESDRQQQAIAIVRSLPQVRDYLNHSENTQHDGEDREWAAESDLDSAAPDEPWFCPGEFVVYFRAPNEDLEKVRAWEVDVQSRRVTPTAYYQSGSHPVEPRADNRITACLDGRPPVQLDPAVLRTE